MIDTLDLISPEYLAEQVTLHSHPRGYGGKGRRYVDTVMWLMAHYQANSVLDYGCGEGSLAWALDERGVYCHEYDPAISLKSALPKPADLVIVTDVLEHIEIDKLANVLSHIGSLARKAIFLVVALEPTNKTLSDGRNAHVILQRPAWWEAKLDEHHWIQEDVDVPLPEGMTPEKRSKRWIAVYRPC